MGRKRNTFYSFRFGIWTIFIRPFRFSIKKHSESQSIYPEYEHFNVDETSEMLWLWCGKWINDSHRIDESNFCCCKCNWSQSARNGFRSLCVATDTHKHIPSRKNHLPDNCCAPPGASLTISPYILQPSHWLSSPKHMQFYLLSSTSYVAVVIVSDQRRMRNEIIQ